MPVLNCGLVDVWSHQRQIVVIGWFAEGRWQRLEALAAIDKRGKWMYAGMGLRTAFGWTGTNGTWQHYGNSLPGAKNWTLQLDRRSISLPGEPHPLNPPLHSVERGRDPGSDLPLPRNGEGWGEIPILVWP